MGSGPLAVACRLHMNLLVPVGRKGPKGNHECYENCAWHLAQDQIPINANKMAIQNNIQQYIAI